MKLPDQFNDLHIERDEDSVVIRLMHETDGPDQVIVLPAIEAKKVAQIIDRAAYDAKRYEDND